MDCSIAFPCIAKRCSVGREHSRGIEGQSVNGSASLIPPAERQQKLYQRHLASWWKGRGASEEQEADIESRTRCVNVCATHRYSNPHIGFFEPTGRHVVARIARVFVGLFVFLWDRIWVALN